MASVPEWYRRILAPPLTKTNITSVVTHHAAYASPPSPILMCHVNGNTSGMFMLKESTITVTCLFLNTTVAQFFNFFSHVRTSLAAQAMVMLCANVRRRSGVNKPSLPDWRSVPASRTAAAAEGAKGRPKDRPRVRKQPRENGENETENNDKAC